MRSLRDALLVARFEVLRAVRTWRALALVVLYLIATAGGAWLFTELIHSLETSLAETLAVPATDRPGAMLDKLLAGDEFRRVIGSMVGSQALVDEVLRYPVLAVFHLWASLILIPFFAASVAAEALSIDLANRSLRFEALRTGRLELVVGRFLGQAGLTAGASFLAVTGTWAVGTFRLVGTEPLVLLGALLWLTVRGWAFALPFVGLGVACSAFTRVPNWARVLAVGGTAASWVAYGLAREFRDTAWGPVSDIALQLLPQGWMGGLWHPAPGWIVACGVCAALGFALLAPGWWRMTRRDL